MIIHCLLFIALCFKPKYIIVYQLLQEEVCHEANATLVIVPSCPENDIMYQKRSKRKMCESYPKCLGEPLVYHCVRSTESLVEVCAPNGPIVGLSACLSIYRSIIFLYQNTWLRNFWCFVDCNKIKFSYVDFISLFPLDC